MTTKIKDVRLHMKNVTLTVKVAQKPLAIVKNNQKRHASAIVGDETGRIKLNLRRERVGQVKTGDVIKIPKAFVHRSGRGIQISTWSNIECIDP